MRAINKISEDNKFEKIDKLKDIYINFLEIIEGQDEYIGELLKELEKINKNNQKLKKEIKEKSK